jgi:hypothetical protein
VTSVKLRRGPCDDNRDFKPVTRKAHSIKPIKVGIGDRGYDDEKKNHEFLREELHADSIIPARYQDIPVWRTRGRYRKEMKRGYSRKKYHQRSKDETVFSVIKRTMGDEVRSVKTRAQNNEMRFRVMAYNAARIASLAYSLVRGFLLSRQKVNAGYQVGVIDLKEPDDVIKVRDQSTGTERWIDIFFTENLWSWSDFIKLRINMGDHEPTMEAAFALSVPSLP